MPVIKYNGKNIRIEGGTFETLYDGIKIVESNMVKIINNHFGSIDRYGINLCLGYIRLIEGNSVSGDEYKTNAGVYLDDGGNDIIVDNVFEECVDGILYNGGDRPLISQNAFYWCTDGIHAGNAGIKIGANTYLGVGTEINGVATIFGDNTPYNAGTWDTNMGTATKNAIRDKIESMITAYHVTTEGEFNSAITAIGAGFGIIRFYAGTIVLTSALNVNGGGSYIIEGYGDKTIIDVGGDWKAFNITSATSCILRNFKIEATDITTNITRVIDITEVSDNKIIVDNITVIGDGSNGLGIYLGSDNCVIKNCWVQDVYRGIYLDSVSYCKITKNTCYSNNNRGIYLSASNYNVIKGNNSHDNSRDGIYLVGSSNNAIVGNVLNDNIFVGIYLYSASNYNNITGNTCYSNDEEGIYIRTSHNNNISVNVCCANGTCGIWLNSSSNNTITGNTCNDNDLNDANVFAGIYISGDSDQNAINGNTCNNNNNIGAGTGHGIHISDNTCDDNTVMGNTALGNDTNYVDNGTNTFDSAGGNPLNNFVAGAG